jgi:hypothetical protein
VADVFISYAKADRPLALKLAAMLEAEGWKVWWDTSLTIGDDFRNEIMTELGRARAVIVIWTDAFAWLEEYRLYHRDADGRVVAENDDAISASRYGLMMRRHARVAGWSERGRGLGNPRWRLRGGIKRGLRLGNTWGPPDVPEV